MSITICILYFSYVHYVFQLNTLCFFIHCLFQLCTYIITVQPEILNESNCQVTFENSKCQALSVFYQSSA